VVGSGKKQERRQGDIGVLGEKPYQSL